LAGRLASMALDGASFLEVAPGPGFLAIELARGGKYQVTGLDISETSVGIARRNAQREGRTVDFRLGKASAMPFANDSFEFVVCPAAFKNFSAPVLAGVPVVPAGNRTLHAQSSVSFLCCRHGGPPRDGSAVREHFGSAGRASPAPTPCRWPRVGNKSGPGPILSHPLCR